MPTTTDISSFTPEQKGYFGAAAKLAPVGSVVTTDQQQGPAKPVGAISTEQGVQTLQKQMATATRLSGAPAPAPTAPVKTETPPAPTKDAATQTKVTLINPATEQTVTFNDAGINKENIQGYLNSGYQLSEAEGNIPSWMSPGSTDASHPALDTAQTALDTAKSTLTAAVSKLTNFDVSNDPQLKNIFSGITSQWDSRIAEMQASLASHTAALKQTGIRLGERFTGGSGGMTGSIISADETNAINQISSLQAQKASALAAAQNAYETQQWGRYSDLVNIAQKAHDQMLTQVETLQKAQATQDAKLQADQQASLLSVNIAKLFAAGVTKPDDILTQLRKSGDTTTTLADIGTAVNTLTPKAAKDDGFTFSQSQMSQLLASGLTPEQIQALHDHYNGKADGAIFENLTPEQLSAAHDALNGTASKIASSAVPSYAQLHPKAGTAKPKTYKSGTMTYDQTILDGLRGKIVGSKGSDGYVDPNVYLQAAESWTKDGGAIKDFLKNYPVSSYVNPANTFVTPTIDGLIKQDAAAVSTAKPTTDVAAQIDALFK